MEERHCPKCGRTLEIAAGATFCPFCGASLTPKAADSAEVSALLRQAANESDPKKRYAALTKAQALAPESLAVCEELLFLGRLHERTPKKLDFSIIKSFLLQMYLTPKDFTEAKADAMRAELFEHPLLLRCLALAPDPQAYMTHYLTRLSGEYIDLFLRGSSVYMRRYFGFGMESRAPKYLAEPAGDMLARMRADDRLSDERRALLTNAFYEGFSRQMNGETRWLDERLEKLGVTLR